MISNYKGSAIPLIIFINNSGEEVDRMVGYKPPKEYFAYINSIVDGKSTYLSLYNKFKSGDRSENTLALLSKKSDNMKNDDLSNEIYSFISQNKNNFSLELIEGSEFFFASSKKGEQMTALLNEFISRYPNSLKSMDAYHTIIDYYQSIQDTSNEIDVYTKMVVRYPQDIWVLNGYSWRMSQIEKNLTNALEKAKEAIDLSRNDPNSCAMILDTKAEILWKLGRTDEAVNTINMAISIDPSSEYYKKQKAKFSSSRSH